LVPVTASGRILPALMCGSAAREAREQRLRLAAEDVGDRRADAAIRDVLDVDVVRDLQLLHREMRERAGPDEP
jgi:hypothetical protein